MSHRFVCDGGFGTADSHQIGRTPFGIGLLYILFLINDTIKRDFIVLFQSILQKLIFNVNFLIHLLSIVEYDFKCVCVS